MTKGFKFRFSLPSFQFCRSKQPSALPNSHWPPTIGFSPVNPKPFDIAYPSFPDPPPSPNHPSLKLQVSSKITPLKCEGRSKVRIQKQYTISEFIHESTKASKRENNRKIYKSPVSDESDDYRWPVTPTKDKKKKIEKNRTKKSKGSVCLSVSSADSGLFSSEDGDNNKETESLVSSSRSFDSSYDFGYSLETITETPISGGRRAKKNNLKVRRLTRYPSNSWKNSEKIKKAAPESESPVKKSVFRRMMPCTENGKVLNESLVVVKKSEDPYEDFKRSMLEMILEKEIVEYKDLEQLLQCFLSLNSRQHQGVIVEAFTDIWEGLFCESPKSQRASSTGV
ncbi:unnamed protein product [Ilex paraguariensis]|uniref:Transcription repressor n=1 Tax=Ilex paraguariensis TaxID=185542 RepID=A0ABC8UC51_9AQUA